jgi:hypothetical protein
LPDPYENLADAVALLKQADEIAVGANDYQERADAVEAKLADLHEQTADDFAAEAAKVKGQLDNESSKLKQAVEHIEAVEALKPNDAAVAAKADAMRENLGVAHENDGDNYLKRIEANPTHPQATVFYARALEDFEGAQMIESTKTAPDAVVESRLAEKIESTEQLLGQAKIEEAKTFEDKANKLAEQGKLEAGIAQMEEAVGLLQAAAELVTEAQEPLAATIAAAEAMRGQLAEKLSDVVKSPSSTNNSSAPPTDFGEVKIQISLPSAGGNDQPRRTRASTHTGDW